AEDEGVAQDGGIVHDDVDAAEGPHRQLDEMPGGAGRGDAVVVGEGLLAHRRGGFTRHRGIAAVAADRGAVVAHDHAGAFGDQRSGDGAADAAARAGYDGSTSLEKARPSGAHSSAPVFLPALAISAAV